MYRVIRSYSRLLRAPSSLILSISRDRASTTSLINLCQCLTILNLGNFFLISSPNLPFLSLKPFPLVLLQQTPLKSLPHLQPSLNSS